MGQLAGCTRYHKIHCPQPDKMDSFGLVEVCSHGQERHSQGQTVCNRGLSLRLRYEA